MEPSYFFTFIRSQLFCTPAQPTTSLTGRTYIVTGSNTGLGLEAARLFTKLGASKVILACRSTSKGEAAQLSIERSTDVPAGTVEVWPLDLGSFASVREFAKRAEGLERLDGVVENAGISTPEFTLVEGHESTVTVNVVSTFLLALLLLPVLKRTATRHNVQPVLSIVSSEVHFFTNFPQQNSASIFDALDKEEGAQMMDRYNVSKLLEVLYLRALCGHLPDSYPVTINMLNPGLCYSELTRGLKGPLAYADAVLRALLARRTDVGARTLVLAALGGPETHGKYMSDGVVARTSSFVSSQNGTEVGERVWKELNEILEGIEPGMTKNL